jgi:Leucine-rich repeat (LRR) protein
MTNTDKLNEKIQKSYKNQYLDLSDLELDKLPEIASNFYSTKYLFLNNNNLTDIDLTPFKNLHALDISNNPIESIQFLPETIEELVCNSCSLKHITQHNKLKKLFCSLNLLEQIEKYPNLAELECDNNKINTICTFNNLKALSCGYNPLQEIETQPCLKYLECQNTEISSIEKFNKLEILDVSNTNITSIPYIKTLRNVIIDKLNILISPEYKLDSLTEYGGVYDLIFQ